MMMVRDVEDSEEDIFKVELEDVDLFVDYVYFCFIKVVVIDVIVVKFICGVLFLLVDL